MAVSKVQREVRCLRLGKMAHGGSLHRIALIKHGCGGYVYSVHDSRQAHSGTLAARQSTNIGTQMWLDTRLPAG